MYIGFYSIQFRVSLGLVLGLILKLIQSKLLSADIRNPEHVLTLDILGLSDI